jgi:hypothetical protein
MTDFNEVANVPVEMTLLGRKVKVRRVPLMTIIGRAEAAVLATRMARIREMAATVPAGHDRNEFLAIAVNELPSGEQLSDMAESHLRSISGIVAVLLDSLRTDQPDIEKELDMNEVLKIGEKSPDVAAIVAFAIGKQKPQAQGAAADPLPPAPPAQR